MGGVANADLAANAVNSAKIANGQVANADLAANAVNSGKIANGQVANADLAANAVNSGKIANGSVAAADLAVNSVNSAKIVDGSIGTADISAAAQDALTAYSGANWGTMHRNVIGNGDTHLQAGPGFVQVEEPPDVEVVITPAPAGVGSLAVRTGATADKSAFGNALDFLGDPVADLTAVSFFVFTTGENIDINPANLPNINIEVLANLTPAPGDYTTMVFTPPNTTVPGGTNSTRRRWRTGGAPVRRGPISDARRPTCARSIR